MPDTCPICLRFLSPLGNCPHCSPARIVVECHPDDTLSADPEPNEPRSCCPHCGWVYRTADNHNGLVPPHSESGREGDWACPGSQQNPRNPESDRRPLWNGQPPPAQTVVECHADGTLAIDETTPPLPGVLDVDAGEHSQADAPPKSFRGADLTDCAGLTNCRPQSSHAALIAIIDEQRAALRRIAELTAGREYRSWSELWDLRLTVWEIASAQLKG